jgi:hypothetical protein
LNEKSRANEPDAESTPDDVAIEVEL